MSDLFEDLLADGPARSRAASPIGRSSRASSTKSRRKSATASRWRLSCPSASRRASPSLRTKAILEQLSNVGELMGARQRFRQALPRRRSVARQAMRIFALSQGDQSGSSQLHLMVLRHGRHNGAHVGAGQVYFESSKGAAGIWLEGGKSSTLHV